jgi:hypothetical protein
MHIRSTFNSIVLSPFSETSLNQLYEKLQTGQFKVGTGAGRPWLTPVILASWEAEIGKILVRGQPMQIVQVTPSPK